MDTLARVRHIAGFVILLLANACGGGDADDGTANTTPATPPVLDEPQCPESGAAITEEIRAGCYIGTQFHVVQARTFDGCEVFAWGDIFGYFWGEVGGETLDGQLRDRENDDPCVAQ